MKSICNKEHICKALQRLTAVIMAVIVMMISVYLFPPENSYAQTQQSLEEYEAILDTYNWAGGYRSYLDQADQTRPEDVYVINAADYVRTQDMDVEEYENYEGEDGISVLTGNSGLIEYETEIKTPGLYEISLRYYPVRGNGSSIQRSFFIDGELPYSELSCIEFSRVWKNLSNTWNKDNQGNDLKPEQVEAPEWMDSYLYDSEGYVSDKLSVYLSEGIHTITIVSQREPMMLRSITLSNSKEPEEYAAVKEAWDQQGAADTSGQLTTVEAESAVKKSSRMLYPLQDQSTPAVTPYSPKCLLNNTIGGTNWQDAGKWLEWQYDIPESGYYDLSMYVKQNFVQGIPVNRKITIDGKVPFEEFNAYQFNYSGDWRMDTAKDENGKPYKIYLGKGTHTIRMEVVLGDFAQIIDRVEDVIQRLNAVYRKVIRITGVSPDKYRDYELASTLAGTDKELAALSTELTSIIDTLKSTAGVSGESERILITMRDQLNELSRDPERFSKILDSYKTNVSAMGTWVGDVSQQPLQLDRIYLYSPDLKAPKVNDGLFQKLLHEIKKLYYKNGSWTWDKFEELCTASTQDTDNNGVTDIYGYGGDLTLTLQEFLASNNAVLVKEDKSEGLTDPKTLEVFQFLSKLYNDDQAGRPINEDWNDNIYAWTQSKCVFAPTQMWILQTTEGINFNYRIVPWPKGPSGDGTKAGQSFNDYFVIPKGIKDADKVYQIMEEFFGFFGDDLETRDSDMIELAEGCFLDENDVNTSFQIGDMGNGDIWTIVDTSYIVSGIFNSVCATKDMTASQAVEANKQLFQDEINTLLK